MPAVTTADQVRREDLADGLILADDRNVVLLPRLRKGPVISNSPFYWGVEKSNERRILPVPEGIDAYAFEGDTAKKLANRKQKWWRNPMVTTEAERMGGNVSPTQKYKGQKAKKIREQSFDVETVFLGDQDAAEDRGVKDRGEAMMALGRAINDGTSIGASGAALTFGDQATAIPQDYRTPTAQIYTGYLVALDGVTAVFTEATINDMMRNRFDQLGGSAELSFFTGSLLKSHISRNFGRYEPNRTGFTVVTRTVNTDPTRLTKGVDVFEGDNGMVDVTQCSFMPYTTRGYMLDMTDVAMRPLFYLEHEMLPYEGAGTKGLIESILSLEFGSPLKHMKIDPKAFASPV